MSDEEEQNLSEEEEEDDEEQEEQDEEQEDEDQDDDQDQGSGDEEGDQEDQDQDQDQQSGQDESKPESEQKPQQLPKFRSIEPQQLKFTSILSELSSLSLNVDHFIGTLPSNGGAGYRKYLPPMPRQEFSPKVPLILPEQSRVVVMKDQDVQVSMQPQIVIQPTKIEKPAAQPSYKISNESNKFLAQLYQENKKLKRWSNSSHNMNTQKGGSYSAGFYGSRQRFERKDYEKGLFDVEQRNREIDEAIDVLKRSEL